MFENSGTSMCNSDIMQRWILVMMGEQAEHSNGKKNILIMDSFAGHRTQEVGVACSATNTLRALIPGGLTSKLQPLDLTVNKSFKVKMKKYYRDAIRTIGGTAVTSSSSSSYPQSYNISKLERLQLLCSAVRRAWNDIRSQTIRNGFGKMLKCLRST